MNKKPVQEIASPKLAAYHVLPDSPLMQRDFLLALASLETLSDHPLAKDVVRVAQINAISPVSVSGFQSFAHKGIGGLIQFPHEQRPRAIVVGSAEFVAECGLQMPDILEVTLKKWTAEPRSVVSVGGWDNWVRGIVKWLV